MWLSLFAYAIKAGIMLGLVKTESDDPQQRAYIRCHQTLMWLRQHLEGAHLRECQPQRLILDKGRTLEFEAPHLRVLGAKAQMGLSPEVFVDPRHSTELDLGEQGAVEFSYTAGQLHITLQVSDSSTGQVGVWRHQIRLGILLEPP